MITVDGIKDSMRVKSTSIDEQVGRNIDSCLLDLKLKGINTFDAEGTPKSDGLIDKAVELYNKADFDYQGKGDKFQIAYDRLVAAMQMCGEYRL